MAKKIENKPDFNGLTVNERLMVSGMLKKFDEAAHKRNRKLMIAILRKVALTDHYAAQWVDTLLGDSTYFYR